MPADHNRCTEVLKISLQVVTVHVFKPVDLFKFGRCDETSTSSTAPKTHNNISSMLIINPQSYKTQYNLPTPRSNRALQTSEAILYGLDLQIVMWVLAQTSVLFPHISTV